MAPVTNNHSGKLSHDDDNNEGKAVDEFTCTCTVLLLVPVSVPIRWLLVPLWVVPVLYSYKTYRYQYFYSFCFQHQQTYGLDSITNYSDNNFDEVFASTNGLLLQNPASSSVYGRERHSKTGVW